MELFQTKWPLSHEIARSYNVNSLRILIAYHIYHSVLRITIKDIFIYEINNVILAFTIHMES